MDWLVERHVRPLYDATVELFARSDRAEAQLPAIPAPHLYYILTGAGPTMFVLAPECRRLSGIDPDDPNVIEAHADAVLPVLFGREPKGQPMQHDLELAYVGIEVPDPQSLTPFFGEVSGSCPESATAGGAVTGVTTTRPTV